MVIKISPPFLPEIAAKAPAFPQHPPKFLETKKAHGVLIVLAMSCNSFLSNFGPHAANNRKRAKEVLFSITKVDSWKESENSFGQDERMEEVERYRQKEFA